ncbi:MAG: chorismate-binding protein [Bacteriovoracaceae bacterium]|nr:chorismate-binding protein [Bacteriovoracaceae bacterium]
MIYSLFYFKNKNQYLKFQNAEYAYLYYANSRLNLLSNTIEAIGVTEFIREVEEMKVSTTFSKPWVCHLYYEFSHLIELKNIDKTAPLVLVVKYQDVKTCAPKKAKSIALGKAKQATFARYEKAFAQIQNHLKAGDCYQVNLTTNATYEFPKEIRAQDFTNLFLSSSPAAYAHLTYIPSLERMYFSNSPECLFGIKNETLFSLPIKGSAKLESEKDFSKTWKTLSSSQKEQAELFMISDLIRNDLNRIALPTAKVVQKKRPLRVPDILHQYSKIAVKVNKSTSMWKIVSSLFPGGSITGAPKKRVLEILKKVEWSARGFYCGSTLLFFGEQKQASINIRSATIDFQKNILTYGSGGGVTLLSECENEFDEMLLKQKSFTSFLSKNS